MTHSRFPDFNSILCLKSLKSRRKSSTDSLLLCEVVLNRSTIRNAGFELDQDMNMHFRLFRTRNRGAFRISGGIWGSEVVFSQRHARFHYLDCWKARCLGSCHTSVIIRKYLYFNQFMVIQDHITGISGIDFASLLLF